LKNKKNRNTIKCKSFFLGDKKREREREREREKENKILTNEPIHTLHLPCD